MFCCKILDRSRLITASSGLCGANGTGCTFGGELYGGGRCSFGVAVWRFYNGRRLGWTLLFGCQSLVMGMSNGLIIEVCFLEW